MLFDATGTFLFGLFFFHLRERWSVKKLIFGLPASERLLSVTQGVLSFQHLSQVCAKSFLNSINRQAECLPQLSLPWAPSSFRPPHLPICTWKERQ